MRHALPVLAIVFGLAACSPPAPAEGDPAAEVASSGVARPSAAPPTAGASQPLDIGVVDAAVLSGAPLNGELGCSFAPSPGGEALFVGRGDVVDAAGAEGLVLVDGEPTNLTMDRTGGYNAMSRGARFTGGDASVAIVLKDEEPVMETPPVATESPIHPAIMTVARGVRTVRIDGFYECGP